MSPNGSLHEVELSTEEALAHSYQLLYGKHGDIPFDDGPSPFLPAERDMGEQPDGADVGAMPDEDDEMALEAIGQDESYQEVVALAAHAERERDGAHKLLTALHRMAVDPVLPDATVRTRMVDMLAAWKAEVQA